MILLSHGMNPGNESDVRIARSRVRDVTMAAEGRLTTSESSASRRRTLRAWAGPGRRGGGPSRWPVCQAGLEVPGEEPATEDDNERILRYLAKITINSALVHGLAHEVGRLAVGHLADIVLWRPQYFAAKPQLVIKGGFPAWGVTGDPNASIDSAEPLVLGPQYGAHGAVPSDLAVLFSNQAAVAGRRPRSPGASSRCATAGPFGPATWSATVGSVRSGSAMTVPRSPWTASGCRWSLCAASRSPVCTTGRAGARPPQR